VITVGTTLESSRWSVRCAEEHDEVYAAVAIHPNETGAAAEPVVADIEALARLPRSSRSGRPGLTITATTPPRTFSAGGFVSTSRSPSGPARR